MEKIWKKRVNGIILEDLNGRVGEMMWYLGEQTIDDNGERWMM